MFPSALLSPEVVKIALGALRPRPSLIYVLRWDFLLEIGAKETDTSILSRIDFIYK